MVCLLKKGTTSSSACLIIALNARHDVYVEVSYSVGQILANIGTNKQTNTIHYTIHVRGSDTNRATLFLATSDLSMYISKLDTTKITHFTLPITYCNKF